MTDTDTSAAPSHTPGDVPEQRAGVGDADAPTPADLDPISTDNADRAVNQIGWQLAQLRRLKVAHNDIAERFGAELTRIERVMNERLEVIENEVEHRTGIVQAAHLALFDAGAAGKTIHTPHGASKLKQPTAPQVFNVDGHDLADLLPWAEQSHPDIVKRSLNITAVRKVVEATEDGKVVDRSTGEVIDGLFAQVPRPTVSVAPAEGEPV